MLMQLSDQLAGIVERVAPSVVQVQGDRRPASGLIYSSGFVLTTGAAVGREEHPRVRGADGQTLDAEPAGWDPVTQLVLLKVPGLAGSAPAAAPTSRVGQIALAIARSWSNAVTVTAGLVSVIGGPLRVGHRRAIEQVIRTSAPMHEGFAGGALVAADGTLLGVATAASIRGLGVVIPAAIAWAAAADLQRRGTLKRGYIGIAAQPVSVVGKQREIAGSDSALLIVSVSEGSPADRAGLLVGDLLVSLGGHALSSPDDLLELLFEHGAGQTVSLRVVRGGAPADVSVTVGERR